MPSKMTLPMSDVLLKKLESSFKAIDTSGDQKIERKEVMVLFTSFAKISADEVFKEIDTNHDGTISFEEWKHYFQRVVDSEQYKDEEICDEIDMFIEGFGFYKFTTSDELRKQKKLDEEAGVVADGAVETKADVTTTAEG